jgi:hypothetical protein
LRKLDIKAISIELDAFVEGMHEDEEDLPMRLGNRELLKVRNFLEISLIFSA